MNTLDLFFGKTGIAIATMFQWGVIPYEKDFHELTDEQYQGYFAANGHTDEKVFAFVPEHTEMASIDDEVKTIYCLTESEKESFKDAIALIDSYCSRSEHDLETQEDKLRYVASLLPDVFAKNTRYERNTTAAL